MKTSKPNNATASTSKANPAGFKAMQSATIQGRQSYPLVGSTSNKTYKKKQYTTSLNLQVPKEEKKPAQLSHRKSGAAGAVVHQQKGLNTKKCCVAPCKMTEHVFKVKNIKQEKPTNVMEAFKTLSQITAEESTETNSGTNSPSQLKFSSMVVVKSPEKLVPSDLFTTASNCCKQDSKCSNKNHAHAHETHVEVTNFGALFMNEQGANNNNIASEDNLTDNCSGYQSTDFQTAYENQSSYNQLYGSKTNKNGDSISEDEAVEANSSFNNEKLNKMMANAESGNDVHSMNCSRRGSFSITTASEMMNHESQINDINSAMNDSEVTSVTNDQGSLNDGTTTVVQSVPQVQTITAQFSKFKANATPFFFPKEKLTKQPLPTDTTTKPQAALKDQNQNQPQQSKGALASSLMNSGLDSLTLDNEFTPSTPYVHKFRTEMCKNYQLTGKCKFGDECSFAHGKTHMMVKTDVSILYKTKLCKKYSANGYCPYGMRCQFIHDQTETNQPAVQQTQKIKQVQIAKQPTLPPLKLNEIVSNAPIFKSTEQSNNSNKGDSTAESTPKDKTFSAINVKPFVPSVKILAETKSEEVRDDTAVRQNKQNVSVEIKQQPLALNPESVAFVPTKNCCDTVCNHQHREEEPQPMLQQKGGFGNKQASIALASEKVIYNEVLVHCVKLSIQEYQKKHKMFNKKVKDKKRYLDSIEPPTLQYINIYSHGNVKRLSCFKRITECSAAFLNVKDNDDNEGGYFYGDATSYEKHLDAQLSRMDKVVKSGHFQPKNYGKSYQYASNETEINYNGQRNQQVANYNNNNNFVNYLSYVSVGTTNYASPTAPQPQPIAPYQLAQISAQQNEQYMF